ncbi:MAG: hypothetical protein IJF12_02140 [Alphaproteobacteria bacterium]|nr:hypothetical protein [Alphaproteobacteria bacterium]MBQ2810948.1 hypothetical protein [Alphaproteobacteria bacterium]
MKKCLLFIVALILAPIMSMAQFPYSDEQTSDYEKPSFKVVKGSFIVHSGYNFFQNTALAGVDLCCNIGYIQGNLDVGWSYIPYHNEKNHFYYVSLSAGPIIGRKHKLYAQIGGISWVGFCGENVHTNSWHAKLKTGGDICLGRNIFLNLELGYIIPYKNDVFQTAEMLSLRLGLGFRF